MKDISKKMHAAGPVREPIDFSESPKRNLCLNRRGGALCNDIAFDLHSEFVDVGPLSIDDMFLALHNLILYLYYIIESYEGIYNSVRRS